MMGYSTQVAVRFETGQTTEILVEALQSLQSLGAPANLCLRFVVTFLNVILSLLQIHHSCSLVP